MLVDVAGVQAHLGDPTWRLVDARAPERYRGDVEPIDRVPGHIPTAINHFFQTNLTPAGIFLAPRDLRQAFEQVVGGVAADQVVNYCGSGVTACHNVLALEHAGITGTKLYPGSWSEWSSDPRRPVERTSAPARGPDDFSPNSSRDSGKHGV
jgi:thiosulfate/3-mercaptopyruvate sulfurtransferase